LSRRSSLRTTPSDALPARRDFPFGGYTRRLLPCRSARGRGGPLQFPTPPSERSTPLTAGGSSALHFQVLHAFHGLRPDTPGSAPPCPFRVGLTPRQASRRCCGPFGCSLQEALDAGLRRQAFPPDAASLLPGTLATTWTGLPPVGGDELAGSAIRIVGLTSFSSPARALWTRSSCTILEGRG
jgi:hypothetical protein